MKRLLLVSAAFVAMLPMTALARGRVGVCVGPAFAPYGWYGYGWTIEDHGLALKLHYWDPSAGTHAVRAADLCRR
jgi:hypothetical protein